MIYALCPRCKKRRYRLSNRAGVCRICKYAIDRKSVYVLPWHVSLADEDHLISLATLASAGLPLFSQKRMDR